MPAPEFLKAVASGSEPGKPRCCNRSGQHLTILRQTVINWATKNPTDRRVPEALHLAVKSTRYGCTDKETGRWSKAAFDLLHRNYPNSTWAKADTILVQGIMVRMPLACCTPEACVPKDAKFNHSD